MMMLGMDNDPRVVLMELSDCLPLQLADNELMHTIVPLKVLLDSKRRNLRLVPPGPCEKEIPEVRGAEVALTALSACKEALEHELLIATLYVQEWRLGL